MSDPKNTETDKMPGFGTNPSMSFASIPARVEYNASNNVPSEYIFDQGLCYPAANSYAYYAGFEPPGEWVDDTSFLGSDGQNLQLSGLQNESLPYTYYSPGYGTAYSSPDQYNAYMSGMAMGVDGLFVGTQQYFASPFYQPPGAPSGYFPIFVQPAADFVPDVSSELPLFGSGQSVVSRPPNASIKNRRQITRNTAAPYQNAASGNPTTDLSWSSHQNQNTNKLSDLPGINVPRCDTSSSSHVTIQVSALSAGKDGHSTEATHSTNHMSPGSTSFQNSEVTSHGWTSGEKYVAKVENGNPNVLFEQNGGPKMNRSVVPSMSAAAGEGGPSIAASSSAVENIVIHPDQYNKDDFPVDYPDAKFFVIKSYSEDDVHKSIKYNVWSSTPNGNRRLDAAYSDARGRSLGKPRNCPIFLFFSVNTSGQFCGVAEMVGPVDFHKDVDFWQQDKWSGSFPVKWHIIKDVLNSSFRHIILENNENKPVTNSRDTQEILYKSGINMLKIFKNSPMTTSVLDDFPFYEARQKAMLEEKCRCLGRSSDVLFCVPAVVAKSSASVVGEPCEFVKCQFSIKDPLSGKIEQECGTSKQPDNLDQMKNDTVAWVLKRDGVQPAKQAQQLYTGRDIDSTADEQIEKCSSYAASENGSKPAGLDRLIEVNGKGPDEQKAQSEEKPSKSNDSSDKKGLAEKLDGHASLDCRKDGTDGLVGDMKFTHLVMKPQALATWMEGEAKSPGNMVMGISPTGVVKVGSVHIKVNEAGESSSEILGVGMDSLEPKGAKHTAEYMSTNENLVKSV